MPLPRPGAARDAGKAGPLVLLTLVLGLSLVWSIAAQQTGRIATTVDALLAEASFFNGRQVAFRSGVVQDRGGVRLAVTDPAAAAPATGAPRVHPVFVYW